MRRATRRKTLSALALFGLAPRCVWAQAEKVRRIGILANSTALGPLTDPLFAALKERGWVQGKNLSAIYRITGGNSAIASQLARELVEQEHADLVITLTTANAVAAREITSRVPIVMLGSGYPVEAGLAKSLARPGGNVTGVSVYAGTQIWGKYVSLARELRPDLRALGVLFDYVVSDPELEPVRGELRAATRALDVGLYFWRHRSEQDLASSLRALDKTSCDAVLVTNGPIHTQSANAARIGEFMRARRLPMINDLATVVFSVGGVLAYSFNPAELAGRCANMIDRILRGADPGTLPIEYPTRFELTINMKAARALPIVVPQSLLVRADRVID